MGGGRWPGGPIWGPRRLATTPKLGFQQGAGITQVVYDCAGFYPRLMGVNDLFMKLVIRSKRSVVIDQWQIFQAAETDK